MIPLVPFTEAHLDGAVALSRQAGWPHRREDWALVLSISKGVVALDRDRVVATGFCSAMGDMAALNMIIVDERLRGQGLGRRVMDAVMTLAGNRTMRLIATEDGRPLYEKLGFHATGEIVQYQGELGAVVASEHAVRAGTSSDIATIAALDRAASGMERTALLQRIAEQGQLFLSDGGFAMLRAFGRGHVIGPVVAHDLSQARALIAAAAAAIGGGFARIDFSPEPELEHFVTRLGLGHAGGGTAMINGTVPALTGEYTTFALAAQALG